MRIVSMKTAVCFICTLCLSVFFIPDTAHAYLDPGTGNAILQGVLAVLAAVVIVGRQYWHRLRLFFGNFKKSKNMEKDSPDADKKI